MWQLFLFKSMPRLRRSRYLCWRVSRLTCLLCWKVLQNSSRTGFPLESPDQEAEPGTCYLFVSFCCSLVTLVIFMDQHKDIMSALPVKSPAIRTSAPSQAGAHLHGVREDTVQPIERKVTHLWHCQGLI